MLDLDGKWSSTIFQELMDIGGGSGWERWKQERIAAGLPIVDIPKPKKVEPKAANWTGSQKGQKDAAAIVEELILSTGKTGAAAVLP